MTLFMAKSCRSSSQNRIIWLFGVALLIRLVAAIVWEYRLEEDQQFRFGDSAGYWNLAERLATGQPYQYNSELAKVFRTPGYPLLLAPLFWIWETPPTWAARFVGCLFGAGSVLLVYFLTRKIFDCRTGWIAGWLATFYPGGIAMSIFVLAEGPFLFFMLLQLFLMFQAIQSGLRSNRKVLLFSTAGICYGIACLIRPSWILFLPFWFVVAIAVNRDRRWTLMGSGIVMLAFALVMSPWWIRNYQVTGHFVLTSLQTGTSLYDGLNPNATGASNMKFAPIEKRRFVAQARFNQMLTNQIEYEFNRHMTQKAVTWARNNPAVVARLAVTKFGRIWNPFPNNQELSNPIVSWGIALFYLPILILTAIGCWQKRDQWEAVLFCLLPAIYFSLLHMVFVGSIRYRQPPMMLLIILAAAGFVALFYPRMCGTPEKKGVDIGEP